MSQQPSRFPTLILVAAGLLAGVGCSSLTLKPDTSSAGVPCATQPGLTANMDKQGKVIWANSLLFCDAPPLELNTWLSKQPELKGKFVLIEFWRTWCGACKRSVPLLNALHEKYGQDLVVIAVTGEPEETVKAYDGPKMNYFMAIDKPGTKGEADNAIKDQGALEERFGVWGWPHVVLLEPENHAVIWEGFPLLSGYELTAEKIERALAVGRTRKAEAKP